MRRIREKIICFIIMPLIITGSILIDKQLPHKAEEIKTFEPDLSVETMYLTVFKGNSENNTDHTWEEINKYSNSYYEEQGIERYQTESLLQCGDENGPLPDKLGFGQTQANSVVSIRGSSSSNAAQKSYRIKLTDQDDDWNGKRVINLNKHQEDGFRFSNKLLYDLMSEVPKIISLDTKFIHLFVKDVSGGKTVFEDYGLYTYVDQLNKDWLENHGMDKYGYLYKENVLFEFYRYEDDIKAIDDPSYNEKNFTTHLKTVGSNDHGKIIKMLDDLNYSYNPTDKLIKKYFDEENIAYWMAFMILTGNVGDTTSHNKYIYSPRNKHTWYIIPWDNDKCFWNYRFNIAEDDSIAWRESVRNYWGNSLFQKCLSLPKFRDLLNDAVNDLYENYMNHERFSEKVNEYSRIVKPYIYRLPDIENAVYSEEKYNIMVENLTSQVDKNYSLYFESLKSPMPFFTGDLEQTDEGIKVKWNNSYDLNGSTVTYDLRISDTPSFENIIAEEHEIKSDDLNKPVSTVLPITLSPGKYFLNVKARNEAGYSQDSFELYIENDLIYNAVCFNVLQNGTITTEV